VIVRAGASVAKLWPRIPSAGETAVPALRVTHSDHVRHADLEPFRPLSDLVSKALPTELDHARSRSAIGKEAANFQSMGRVKRTHRQRSDAILVV
jgi:hypothetical protein